MSETLEVPIGRILALVDFVHRLRQSLTDDEVEQAVHQLTFNLPVEARERLAMAIMPADWESERYATSPTPNPAGLRIVHKADAR